MVSPLIYGAMEGAGEAGAKTLGAAALEQQRIDAQTIRDQTLSALKRGEIAFEGQTKIGVEQQSPRVVPQGATVVANGQPQYTAPNDKSLSGYYTALANELNAHADSLRRDKPTVDKGALPSIKMDKDADGNPLIVDQNSGAIGTIMAPQAGRPGVSHWFKPDEPAQAPKAADIVWTIGGKSVPGGLPSLYPALQTRMGDQGGAAPKSAARPPLSSFGAPADAAPAAAPAQRALVAPAAPTDPNEAYLEHRRSGVAINAPGRMRAARLNGHTFPTREAALQAIRALPE